jgi:acetolactate synthase-1/3 small subunit
VSARVLTFIVYLDDRPDALVRVAAMVRRRGFRLASLTVGHTETAGVSRLTLVLDADARLAPRVEALLHKLVDVIRVENVTEARAVCRGLAMIKVTATPETRAAIMQLVHVFRARVVDVAPDSLVVEITGTEEKIDSLLEVLRPYGVVEVARTGRLAMARGGRHPNPRRYLRPGETPDPTGPVPGGCASAGGGDARSVGDHAAGERA